MKKVLFYVQNLLGIGHAQRASLIARALKAAGAHVTIIGGGLPYREFQVDYIQLPPIYVQDGEFTLVTERGLPPDEEWWTSRRRTLEGVFLSLEPDIVLIESYPFGRRAFGRELIPLLERAKNAEWSPRIGCSIRDILVPRKSPGAYQSTVETLNRFFDYVLVHGDPTLIRLERSFPLTDLIRSKVAYTGYVADQKPCRGEYHDRIVVSVGGGRVGERLLRTACRAARQSPRRWLLLTGPYLKEQSFQELIRQASSNVRIERSVSNFSSLLAGCRVSISQGGYNTLLEIVQAGCRAIVIPFEDEGETEQKVRAGVFERQGILRVLLDSELSPETLLQKVENVPPPQRGTLNLKGAEHTARFLLVL